MVGETAHSALSPTHPYSRKENRGHTKRRNANRQVKNSWLKEVRKGERGAEDREMKKKLKSERQDPGGEKLQIKKFSLTRQKKKMIGSKDKLDEKKDLITYVDKPTHRWGKVKAKVN